MSEFAYNVTLEDFQTQVVQPSLEVPVLLDFWAPWCGPCQQLKPVLRKLAEEYGGRFRLAMVNSEENPQLAQHFGVRSIPAVKILFGGRIVDEFTGALPEGEIRAILDRHVSPPSPGVRDEAAALVAAGQLEEALLVLGNASHANPEDESIRLDAAELLMQLGRQAEAEPLLATEYNRESARAQALRTRLNLAAGAADIQALQTALDARPDDDTIRLKLAGALAAAGLYREALESALSVVRQSGSDAQADGRKAMLQIFEALSGSEAYDDLVREYRRALSAALN